MIECMWQKFRCGQTKAIPVRKELWIFLFVHHSTKRGFVHISLFICYYGAQAVSIEDSGKIHEKTRQLMANSIYSEMVRVMCGGVADDVDTYTHVNRRNPFSPSFFFAFLRVWMSIAGITLSLFTVPRTHFGYFLCALIHRYFD